MNVDSLLIVFEFEDFGRFQDGFESAVLRDKVEESSHVTVGRVVVVGSGGVLSEVDFGCDWFHVRFCVLKVCYISGQS